jgi:hypothetical protein
MALSDPFFVAVFTVFALDIVWPRLWQLGRWVHGRFYEYEDEEDG